MVEKNVIVTCFSGLHARPAAQFVKTANRFQADIKVSYQNKTANAKSMLEIMMVAAAEGEMILIRADGVDEDQALEDLEKVITAGESV